MAPTLTSTGQTADEFSSAEISQRKSSRLQRRRFHGTDNRYYHAIYLNLVAKEEDGVTSPMTLSPSAHSKYYQSI